ncbi:unnamed protein product [Paramecium primaurelia]|uniref:Uncharacterized protein n=1 Tax=Paramecium primaurelia TaxID=5886 RepID=A0A8S1NUC6_PARPR|nr:unnamed protein product [Paramecium primaurelia]
MGIQCFKCQNEEQQIITQTQVQNYIQQKNVQYQQKQDKKRQYNSLYQNSYFGPSKQQYESQWNPSICVTAKNESNIEAFEESQIQTNQNIRETQQEQQIQRITFISSDQIIPSMPLFFQVSEQLAMDKICQNCKHHQKHRIRTKSENIINKRQNQEKNFLDSKYINKELKKEKIRMLSHPNIQQIYPKKKQHQKQILKILVNGQSQQKTSTPFSQQSNKSKSMSPTPNKVQLYII